MKGKFHISCSDCGLPAGPGFATACSGCGGLLDVSYRLENVRIGQDDNPYRRYFDLLPIHDPELLPKGEMTPLVHARILGRRLGLNHLYLKDETVNPTGTTKDRMAGVALAYLHEAGVTHFCASSTGNSSTAYAHAIGKITGMQMSLFTAESFRDRVHYAPTDQVHHYVLRKASFVDAGDHAAKHARQHGLTAEGGFFNLGRREGLKLVWLEVVEQLRGPIDWYVQAVSSAMGVYGVYKAALEAVELGLTPRTPRLLCAQQTSCMPMAQAWEENSEKILPHHIVSHPAGIAEAILRGNPSRVYPYVRRIVSESGGTMCAVNEAEIRLAQHYVAEDEGIDICPSAATAVAALVRLANSHKDIADQRIVVNLTGCMRTNASPARIDSWLDPSNSGWR